MPNRVLAADDKATRIPVVGRGAFSLAFGSTITAIADTDPDDWAGPGEVPVRVHAARRDGETVVEGVIRLHVSERK